MDTASTSSDTERRPSPAEPAIASRRSGHPAVGTGLPDEAYAAALAAVPGLGPRGLRQLLLGGDVPARTGSARSGSAGTGSAGEPAPTARVAPGSPRTVWQSLVEGARSGDGRGEVGTDPRWRRWAAEAGRVDVGQVWETHRRHGIGVTTLGAAGYPAALVADPEAPAVLFSLGDPRVLDRHLRVAIVGTRSATRYGLGLASELGAELAARGVVVVSGLALGIDAAAHQGALAGWEAHDAAGAPPVAVVAGGLSSPYPRQHARLWRRVADAGAILSEAPVDSAEIRWRFPARNRIMAALACTVIVVECHQRGGSLHTVTAAARRGVPVGAVPGSVRSPASAGTNSLLADGCFVVRDVLDVMAALGLSSASLTAASAEPAPTGRSEADEATVGTAARAVMAALGWERCSLDQVARRTGLRIDAVAAALEQLRASGQVHGEAGSWERA